MTISFPNNSYMFNILLYNATYFAELQFSNCYLACLVVIIGISFFYTAIELMLIYMYIETIIILYILNETILK